MNSSAVAQTLDGVSIVFNRGLDVAVFHLYFLNVLSTIKLRIMTVALYFLYI